jgi:uncharacterized protein (DUF1800 family)
MENTDAKLIDVAAEQPQNAPYSLLTGAATLLAPLALGACGGGGASGVDAAAAAAAPERTAATVSSGQLSGGGALTGITDIAASRFLAQASMGATRDQIERVKALGYAGWLDEQFAIPRSRSHWDELIAGGYNNLAYRDNQTGFEPGVWRKLISSPDTLRQRVTLALSEILVVAIQGTYAIWRQFTAAAYLDLLEANAFGNYRTLLQAASVSPAMGEYMTFCGNRKYNPTSGATPDENFARELMQLFTIGLVQLNPDGTPKLVNGKPQETYSQDDITSLAGVFTGWDEDLTGIDTTNPEFKRRPMIQFAVRHETGQKTFLGTTIPAGGDGASDMMAALDTLFFHPNIAPFISRQLIQRLVTSNPSPAYVARVAAIFTNDGKGIKGNLSAVVKAILLDDEARNPAIAAGIAAGKQREPVLRLTAWARAFKATSPSNAWAIGNTSDPATALGQSPMRSPSVFNFFRPSYVPPSSGIGNAGLVAPEFQLTNETSTVGYINYMQIAVFWGLADVKADYSPLMPLADDAASLFNELNTVLAAGQLSSATLSLLVSAVGSMPFGNDTRRINRIYVAVLLVLAAPEFIILH